MAEPSEDWRTRLDRIERTIGIVAQEMTDAQRRAEERMQQAEERMRLSEQRMDRFDKRMDRISEIMALLAEDHIAFRDEHKRLLIAQVVLDDRQKELAKENAEWHKETREKLNALIKIVDGTIRARPPQ